MKRSQMQKRKRNKVVAAVTVAVSVSAAAVSVALLFPVLLQPESHLFQIHRLSCLLEILISKSVSVINFSLLCTVAVVLEKFVVADMPELGQSTFCAHFWELLHSDAVF
ncbi:MAG: hypothetical protein EZS28_017528 [Streblomastix strix]|uniref:Uncharacterized protein n=1 Tax=Streblomastix strix TaxID=222440 RepID=A0A5J4VW47_9EUKA|nr:MAG: hypothetical protein EZS28_017528 [Streblomastix strix]